MADSVQHVLDRMVKDLEDLRYRGIFSEAEVRAIVAKRKEFEYLLRRIETRKIDFMRYVEYETNLNSLLLLRIKRAGPRKKAGFSSSNISIVRNVRSIFERALVRFPADVELWLEYIDFVAQKRQNKVLSGLFARALQLHPRNAGLWIKAASWEFFEGGNTSSARALMQRALRINSGARDLWLQYFRLEFFYVEKLRGRREILGLEVESDSDGDGENHHSGERVEKEKANAGMKIPQLQEERESDGPNFEGVDEASKAGPVAPAPSASQESKKGVSKKPTRGKKTVVMNQIARRFYQGAVPLAVFRAATKALPDDVEFRALFLRSCLEDFPELGAEVAQAVLASIAEDFPESGEAWEIRASYPLLLAGGSCLLGETSAECPLGSVLTACVEVFEKAVEVTGRERPEIWVRYGQFLRKRLEEIVESDQSRGGGGPCDKEGRSHLALFAGEVTRLLQQVLSRAVGIHLKATKEAAREVEGDDGESIKARKRRRHRELATGKIESDEAEADARAGDREALALGLADVCLAVGDHVSALATLVTATEVLPTRPGPWLRRASLERRMKALAAGEDSSKNGGRRDRGKEIGAREGQVVHASVDSGVDTLREGLRSVSPSDPRYPTLWRELLTCLLAGGAGRRDMEKAFRAAVYECAPDGADPGQAQGEFLADYVRWSGAVGGLEAAYAVLKWARKTFLLAGIGAAQAYVAVLELEQCLGGMSDGGEGGEIEDASSTKRSREIFEELTSKFGNEMPQFWDQYVRHELSRGDMKQANAVRSRAQKAKAALDSSGTAQKRPRQA